ncbi:dihydrolipoyllysine-residue acetyltransferase [Marinobacteraceae bacterium S3BR75-40.1]
MSVEEIHVPDLGGADEVEVIEVNVQLGDSVAEEDPIITVESDKASVELPSPMAGTIKEVKVAVGDTLKEGDLVALIDTDASASSDKSETDEVEEKTSEESKGQDAQAAADEKQAGKAEKKTASGGTRKETVKVPDIGGAEGVPVIEVQVKAGDSVEKDDPVITLESDKATMEIPCPYAGTVDKVLVKEDDTVSEGDAILEMTVSGDAAAEEAGEGEQEAPEPTSEAEEKAPEQPERREKTTQREAEQPAGPPETTTAKVHAGPAVRKTAREFGVDLANVKGSGPKSRILKEDVQQYVKNQLKHSQGAVTAGGGLPKVKLPDFSQFGDVEHRAMTRMQAATAENMHRSWLNVPHVTQFDEADITELETFRKSRKNEGEQRGVKLTPLPFVLKACAYALQQYPQFNVSLDMERREVIQKHYVHIGIAVDTPAGLMVPVIRDVDKKGLWQLAEEAQELAAKARDKKLSPDEMRGACFSITSLGGIGGTAFTPVVNTPEVAILGLSKASMKPVWDGEAFQPRLMLPLSLSYDHRAVNGADAARFTALLSELLGDLRNLLL